ncbi:MAG: metallophosphoesterase [Marinibacterium sp.]|nr:metallophosphoesterase [Marinibacterium sp.]
MTQPIYAIGDIHGYVDELHQALDRIAADGGADAQIVFTGDYTDRGPDSAAVIRTLAEGVSAGRNWIVLRGNHDRMFCNFVADGTVHDHNIRSGRSWLHPNLGGVATLASYGVDVDPDAPVGSIAAAARAAVPAHHVTFLRDRPLYHVAGDLLFVHAGIRPGVALGHQSEDDMVWIREPFLTYDRPFPWLVVHGHTALERPRHFGNRVDIDGGAGFGRPLLPVVFEGRSCWTLGPAGHSRLLPDRG